MSFSIDYKPRFEKLGKVFTAAIRSEGFLPASVYGGQGENMNIIVNKKDLPLPATYGSLMSLPVKLKHEKTSCEVFIKKIDRDTVSNQIIHIDFQRTSSDKEAKVNVALYFINSQLSHGVKAGGILHIFHRSVFLLCSPKNFIREIEIDTSHMNIGTSIKMSDIPLPKGVKHSKAQQHVVIAKIIGKSKRMQKEEGEAANPTSSPAAPEEKPKPTTK